MNLYEDLVVFLNMFAWCETEEQEADIELDLMVRCYGNPQEYTLQTWDRVFWLDSAGKHWLGPGRCKNLVQLPDGTAFGLWDIIHPPTNREKGITWKI